MGWLYIQAFHNMVHHNISTLFLALRSVTYASFFVLLWGWLAVQTKNGLGEWLVLPSSTRWVGVLCVLAGGALALWCIMQFFLVGKGTPAPFDAPRSLVTSGPYGYVRNPMYIGGSVILLGFGLWNNSATMSLFPLFFFLLAHLFVVVYEEPALKSEFGPAYVSYKATVRRWLPKRPGMSEL